MDKHSKVYVAGHAGMVGSSLVRRLRQSGFENLVLRSSRELDLTRQIDVDRFFATERPEYVFVAAARVGGIMANKTYRADFIYVNLQIQCNILHSAWKSGVNKLLFLSSSCVYPRLCPQPMKEEYLWTGLVEPTNEPYAVAKLAGMSMAKAYNEQYGTNFVSVIPTNLYGINDNYDPQQSHVVASLIRKFHMAREEGLPSVVLWGTGSPRRELMYVDDAAEACLFLVQHYSGNDPINIGLGEDLTIREIADMVKQTVGYEGDIVLDSTKPDGAPQKLLDVSKLKEMGWSARTPFSRGAQMAYQAYLKTAAAHGSLE